MEKTGYPAQAAIDEFNRAQVRLVTVFGNTSEEMINWSPAPSARSAVQIMVHAAISIPGLQNLMAGGEFPFSSLDEFDEYSRAEERRCNTREQAVAMVEKEGAAFVAWMESLTPDDLELKSSTFLGSLPRATTIKFNAEHLRCHTAQIEYIQTAYGDRNWYW